MLLHAAVLALSLAAPPDSAIPIYVGLPTRGAFVETDENLTKGVRALRARLEKELKGDAGFRFVDDESAAVVKLYLTTRGEQYVWTGTDVTVTTTGNTTTGKIGPSGSSYFQLTAVLRVGEYTRTFAASSSWLQSSTSKRVAKDVATWLSANRVRLTGK